MSALRLALAFALALLIAAAAEGARAEYGDIVFNKTAEREGMRPVIFPHWFHRIRFRCAVCHQDNGFQMRAGSNAVTMKAIADGRYCGMCHNGEVAWASERCDLCHSGRPGLKPGIQGSHESTGPGLW
jgi:c(7)-type cytochrome triheme protein